MRWIYNDAWDLEGRFCCDCFIYLPFKDYKALRHGWNGRHSRCRLCDNANSKLLYQLKKHYPYPQDGRCEYCLQTSSKPLHLDHNHDTNEFRAWACPPCNLMRRRPWGISQIKINCQPPLPYHQQKLNASRVNTKLRLSFR